MQSSQFNLVSTDPTAQINQFKCYVSMLSDPTFKNDYKLKILQQISNNFDIILSSPLLSNFVNHSLSIFLNILEEGEPQFILQNDVQQIRKFILELIFKISIKNSELLKSCLKSILLVLLKLLEFDNEVNILLFLKIIVELHKHCQHTYNKEIQKFLNVVESMYLKLPNHLHKMFVPKDAIIVKDLNEVNIVELLEKTFTITSIQSEKSNVDNSFLTYDLIPKAMYSLKVMQELPVVLVLLHQSYEEDIYIFEFVWLIMDTINLPTLDQRLTFNLTTPIYIDFLKVQIKLLSLLIYIIKHFEDVIDYFAILMVEGILGLLLFCPMEAPHLRRELLICINHILATKLRQNFIPYSESFLDDHVIIGKGWTSNEALRSLAYSTFADFVHHVREDLTLPTLSQAIYLFCKNVHDESLTPCIQNMSVKLLLSLVNPIRKSTVNSDDGRELMMRMLEIFVLKFKSFVKWHLPILINQCDQQIMDKKANLAIQDVKENPQIQAKDKHYRLKIISDYMNLIKSLVLGVKMITWGCSSCNITNGPTLGVTKKFQSHETHVLIRFIKWSLQAFDVYTINATLIENGTQEPSQLSLIDETEVLGHYGGTFSILDPQTFHELFSNTIQYIVEKVHHNPNLETIITFLLCIPQKSAIFASILVNCLLQRLVELDTEDDKSLLYLKLFKLVFNNLNSLLYEKMLVQYLHPIVNRSLELAMNAQYPHNYLLLLKILFQSLNNGNHNQLYQQFLLLLPNLIERLNSLHSGFHNQDVKDLLVELCLIIPMRLSSLLPYMQMLMDPLVLALNGSQFLISQGLKTLELCVDNLQYEYLNECIQPVRADLMQALWKILRLDNSVAKVAFRILGKFGGANRISINEPQKLDYNTLDVEPPSIIAEFYCEYLNIDFPVHKIVKAAYNALKETSTNHFYRKQAWQLITSYLVASRGGPDDETALHQLFFHPSFQDSSTIQKINGTSYKSSNTLARETHQIALAGVIIASVLKDLNQSSTEVMFDMVRYNTMLAIVQQSGIFASTPTSNTQINNLDPFILIDALRLIMCQGEPQLYTSAELVISLILETATTIMGSADAACQLPFIEYLTETMCSLCYEKTSAAKLGGCRAITVMLEKCDIKWVYEHISTLVKTLIFILMDLHDELSNGALNIAKNNLQQIIEFLAPQHSNDIIKDLRDEASQTITRELVGQVTSPHTIVREQSLLSLQLLAKKQQKPLFAVVFPYKDVLIQMVPPIKPFSNQQPPLTQIGLMEGCEFCISLNPGLFEIDLSIEQHNQFINDLLGLCNTTDAWLNTHPCYMKIRNFLPLRSSALKVLTACYYILEIRIQIFQVLYKYLENPIEQLQEVAFNCLKKIVDSYTIQTDLVHMTVRPLLMTLGDVKSLTLSGVITLSYLTQLFPLVFNERLLEKLLDILGQLLEILKNIKSCFDNIMKQSVEEQIIVTIINIFYHTPSASPKLINSLIRLILTEQTMMIEENSLFRPILVKFLLRYPEKTIDVLLDEDSINQRHYSRFLNYILKHNKGHIFKNYILESKINLLKEMGMVNFYNICSIEMQFHFIKIFSIFTKEEIDCMEYKLDFLTIFKRIWYDDVYHERHENIEYLECAHWMEPKMLGQILLKFFTCSPNDVDLLFHLMRAFCYRYISDFQFLKNFLEDFIVNSSVQWKRQAFFRFAEIFPTDELTQKLKSKIVQFILIPCFEYSLDNGERDELLFCTCQGSDDDVISIFINRLVDSDILYEDCLKISVLKFCCLLTEKATLYIHDKKKTENSKLRRLMTFAWPCLSDETYCDPATKYHGYLLLSHIINKFSIHRNIVLQVFHGLLKAHVLENRNIIGQALSLLIPSIPVKINDGLKMMVHWTKKFLMDDGEPMQQLFHVLQLIVKFSKVYYPERHHLLSGINQSIEKFGISNAATNEQRKLAIELIEVIIKWELEPQSHLKPIEDVHINAVMAHLIRMAVTINYVPCNAHHLSLGEIFSRKCVILLKNALKLPLWSQTIDLNFTYIDKTLATVNSSNENIGSICITLDLLIHFLTVLEKSKILNGFNLIQKSLAACIKSQNHRIVNLFYNLLTKVLAVFPMEPVLPQLPLIIRSEKLEVLYVAVTSVVNEGLTIGVVFNSRVFFKTLAILKAMCASNCLHVDTVINKFVLVVHKLVKEHLIAKTMEPDASGKFLIICFDIIKTKVASIGNETRKLFGTILIDLIEKSKDSNLLKAIVKMLYGWVKTKSVAPNFKEKSNFLLRLMNNVEERFPDDKDLNTQFLELVYFIYTDTDLQVSELSTKLEPAFMSGLRNNQPSIRKRFFKVFNESVSKNMRDRLSYIVFTQNWETVGQYYWIKLCIEFILETLNDSKIRIKQDNCLLPSITSIILAAESEKKNFRMNNIRDELINENFMDVDCENVEAVSRQEKISEMIKTHFELTKFSNNVSSKQFLISAAQLAYLDTNLAEHMWLCLFPRLWSILDDDVRAASTPKILFFIASGAHNIQQYCFPSAINTFVEALCRCNPPILMTPSLMKYVGKHHNLRHTMALLMEQSMSTLTDSSENYRDFLDPLEELYSLLCEEDLWTSLWQKHNRYKATSTAIAFEQHGYFEQAKKVYEGAMATYKLLNKDNSIKNQTEILLWDRHWIRCTKELNQWDVLIELSQKKPCSDPYLLLDSAWRVSNWDLVKKALHNVESFHPPEFDWKIAMYGAFVVLMKNDENNSLKVIENFMETTIVLCLNEWRKLPSIVSHVHLQYLQAAQQVVELQEAYQIHKGLAQRYPSALNEIKEIHKLWTHRLPAIADDLSYWHDIFTWRQHHYPLVTKYFEKFQDVNSERSTFCVHTFAQSIIHFAKAARKQGLATVCIDNLNRIYCISSVHIADCFQKLKEHIKCCLHEASVNNTNKFQEALNLFDNIQVQNFSKEMAAEFYALKGIIYLLNGKLDEAHKFCSVALQTQDTSVKAWVSYGDYLEKVFTKDDKQVNLGINAITCFLHACKYQNDLKASKYISKVLWLLNYDDHKFSLMDAIEQYSVGVTPLIWLPWLPQLLICLTQYESDVIANLLIQISKIYPQAVYFPVRTLYLTLCKTAAVETANSELLFTTMEATPAMRRCSRIMKIQKDAQPTVIYCLEAIAEQLNHLTEYKIEEISRRLKRGLKIFYAIAFDYKDNIYDLDIKEVIKKSVNELISSFDLFETLTFLEPVYDSTSEKLAKKAENTDQILICNEMKQKLKDIDFSEPNPSILQLIIFRLKKCIKTLDDKSINFLQSLSTQDKSPMFSNLTFKMGDIELPGEFLQPKHNSYFVKIVKFMPRIDIVQKHNVIARRLFIRGHDGKIYPYLVINDSSMADDARREERVLQLQRMLNNFLRKHKETCRRFLNFNVPRVVAVSHQIRLVEDNPSSISLLDVYKERCSKLSVQHDEPIEYYYRKLASPQDKGIRISGRVLEPIFKIIQNTMVPQITLKYWAVKTYHSSTDYWQFRKMFTLQLALACFAEYVFHLTKLNPDMMYFHQDSGLMSISYFKIDLNEDGQLNRHQVVPFRLTPCITEFLQSLGVDGPFTASIIAAANCFLHVTFQVKAILRPIFRDEILSCYKTNKITNNHQIIDLVNNAVDLIFERLNNLSNLNGTNSETQTLITAATNWNNLCRMDPTWYPWL